MGFSNLRVLPTSSLMTQFQKSGDSVICTVLPRVPLSSRMSVGKMAKPDADFTVALSELRQVSDTISQGADFFETQISEGLRVAKCVEPVHERILNAC